MKPGLISEVTGASFGWRRQTISMKGMLQMKFTTVAVLASMTLMTACASQGEHVQINQDLSFDDAPTGSLIKRRPVKDEHGNIVKPDNLPSSNPAVIGTIDTKL